MRSAFGPITPLKWRLDLPVANLSQSDANNLAIPCHRLMDDLAGYPNLGNTWFSIKDLGPALSFMILGYLLERTETISNHRGYAFKIAHDIRTRASIGVHC